jgi:TM2 domain-containing membrane protein YozV
MMMMMSALKNLSPYDKETLALMSRLSKREINAYDGVVDRHLKSLSEALVLCVACGAFGGHRFYLNQPKTGWAYLLFSWTLFPFCLAMVDCCFLINDVEKYNLEIKCQALRKIKNVPS